jgi:hypothetical protein
MALYFMYFVYPLLSSEHAMFNNPLLVNTTDATVVTSYNLGQGFYTVLPFIPIIVGGFVVLNYSLKRDD